MDTEKIKLDLQKLMLKHIKEAKAIYIECKMYKLTNEQFFLDWQDELNKISIDNV